MRADVVIVGGGPVGCMTAAAIGKGFSVKILEEHERTGVPEQCAGLVSPRVVDMVGGVHVLNKIYGAHIHFPDGRRLDLLGDEVKACVVERRRFDERCLEMALAVGAELHTGERFSSYCRTDKGISLRTASSKVFDCMIGVGADGYRSTFGRAVGLPSPQETVRGIQVDISKIPEDNSSVDVWVGNKVAPGFFAWSIPCGDFMRVGLCISKKGESPYPYLLPLLKMNGLEGAKRIRSYSGIIPIGHSKKTFDDNVLIVGDAAGQAKPLSGGGLFTGLTAASIAGDVIRKAILGEDCSSKTLREYEARWKRDFGKELDRGMIVRKTYVGMDDGTLNEVGAVLDTERCRAALSKGDIDRPTAIAKSVLRAAPGLIRFSPDLITSFLPRRRRDDMS
ncbi:MAG: NAD(P)/FAD-dependent oxidoreductase [Methanomassiliicoccales archaeon]|nr:MAG: NAD(P)/FAD-dependent oxidoreductase [Methanomassiliicoccales archaeon]